MRYLEIVSEVKTIAQTDEDDREVQIQMKRSLNNVIRRQQRNLTTIAHIQNLTVKSTDWPLSHRSYMFFFDQTDEPIGFAILQKADPYKPVDGKFIIRLIHLVPEYRKKGFGMKFYKFLLDNGITLQADELQTLTAQHIWSKLSNDPNYKFTDIDGILTLQKV